MIGKKSNVLERKILSEIFGPVRDEEVARMENTKITILFVFFSTIRVKFSYENAHRELFEKSC